MLKRNHDLRNIHPDGEDDDDLDQGSGSAVHQHRLVLSLNQEPFRALGEKSTPVRSSSS